MRLKERVKSTRDDAGGGLDAVAGGDPVVDLVELVEVGVLEGEDHDVAFLPECFVEVEVVDVGAIGGGEQSGVFVGHFRFSDLQAEE